MRTGVDLGGTKIEAVLLGPEGAERARRRVETPRDDYDATVEAVVGLVLAMDREAGALTSVGVGTPGTISPATGRIKNANSTWLNGRPLQQDLEARLERNVRLANDANCFALSEATDGAAAGAGIVFGVILGTGVGGGIVVNGRVLGGANAIAGEWGHTELPGENPMRACWCGRRGCVETLLSGPGLSVDYAERSGARLSAREVVARARHGDGAAWDALDAYIDRLARGLSAVINVLDPEVIVVGGGLSQIRELYAAIPARWAEHVFSDRIDTRLVPPVHGDSSGVRGAAWLWPGR